MKLLRADVYGFGTLYKRSFSFQDGIHVIYGPNEAGKSTLHTFIGCMLFGLERGRGRAARSDLYSRYLPWEHDAAYGGSLSFESREESCLLERRFQAGKQSFYFSAPGYGRCSGPDAAFLEPYYEGLTEELYYNTLSVRQLRCPVDASLGAHLRQHFQDIRQAGVSSVRYEAAQSWLKAEKKRLEARLTPGLEQQLEEKKRTASAWEEQLKDTSFLQTKEELSRQMDLCMEQLGAREPEGLTRTDPAGEGKSAAQEPARRQKKNEADGRPRSGSPLPAWLAAFGCLLAALLFIWKGQDAAAGMAGAVAALFALGGIRHILPRKKEDASQEEKEDVPAGDPVLHTGRAQDLRRQMVSLQKQYQDACRREWEYERLAEQAQHLEDELAALDEQAAAEAAVHQELQAVSLAMSTLQRVSGRLEGVVGPHLNDAMSEILSGLTGGAYQQVYVNDKLEVTIRTPERTIPLDSLSRGTVEQVWLALRLAAIDIAFPMGGMPLLLDDCFLAYDEERLSRTLNWLAENYSGQVFLFTCQKREAALLQEERIPFTLITL